MNAEKFADLIKNPSNLHHVSYQDLKSLIAQFPYAANLRYLLVQKSYLEGKKDFDRHLHLAALFSPDRSRLFELFKSAPDAHATDNYQLKEGYLELSELGTPSASVPPAVEQQDPDPGFEPVDSEEVEEIPLNFDLNNLKDETPGPASPGSDTLIPLKDLSAMDDHKKDDAVNNEESQRKSIFFIEDLISSDKAEPKPPIENAEKTGQEEKEGAAQEEKTGVPLELTEKSRPVEGMPLPAPAPKHSFSSWLEQFESPSKSIRYNPKKKPVKKSKELSELIRKKKKKHSKKPFRSGNFELAEDLASETLAKLHVKQGNYAEAIRMYEKLSAILPQKKEFFADQIKKLKDK